MKHEITVKRGIEPWTSGLSGVPDRNCVEMTLYGLPPELLEAMRTRDVKVTLEPVQTREERLREARLEALRAANITTSDGSFYQGIAGRVLQIIERVDAEFAKGEK